MSLRNSENGVLTPRSPQYSPVIKCINLLADIVHGNNLLCELEKVENLPLALIANDKHLLISYSVTVSPRGM